MMLHPDRITPATSSTYPKGGVSCSKDSFVVNGSLVFQIKFCGKSPALRVANTVSYKRSERYYNHRQTNKLKKK
jgi:hypothetical protein